MAKNTSNSAPLDPANTGSFFARYLDPVDRLGEILFGLIMVLTFTLGAGIVVQEGADATREMLIAILGCNLAWGIIDGGIYILSSLYERGRKARLIRAIQSVGKDAHGLAIIRDALDDMLTPYTSAADREQLYASMLRRLKDVRPEVTLITRDDVFGAIASFALVFITAIPAVLPFLFIEDRFIALRVSNALLLAMLFVLGWRWARTTHGSPWLFGSSLVFVGLFMVLVAIALGG